jgi:autotransporter family porin
VERLPSNYAANRTDAADGTSFADAPVSYQRRVTGNFSGTTQQILRWASCKWRIDPLLTFAQAAQESGWRQAATGDGGDSYGILQLRRSTWPDSYPRSAVSTAWNADASRMYLRACIDGKFASWGLEGYLSTKGQERVWYCVGVYFAGEGPSDANGGNAYVASVKRYLANRTWELGGT